MGKNTKILIGVGIAAVAAYFVYRSKQPKAGVSKCPEGTKPCVNNPTKCVSTDPNINYIQDPCKA